jgi:hypothetical protein
MRKLTKNDQFDMICLIEDWKRSFSIDEETLSVSVPLDLTELVGWMQEYDHETISRGIRIAGDWFKCLYRTAYAKPEELFNSDEIPKIYDIHKFTGCEIR